MRAVWTCLVGLWLALGSVMAQDRLPVIEKQADRTIIYPQRMELTGEESLMDILMMVPELTIAGYEDVISGYNLRMDNCPMNADNHLLLSQMKAKDIAKIQVCDNTGVAKGTIGTGRVLDINLKMPGKTEGFAEGHAGLGNQFSGGATANLLYGSQANDLYANASYRYHGVHEEHLTLHMTNRFNPRDRLLTYLTQQYLSGETGPSHKILGRARYFHIFNEQGTELYLMGGYQYATDPLLTNQLPTYVAELNTPLWTPRLSLLVGAEGDYLMTRQKGTASHWHAFNNDVYLQLTCSLPKWSFTAGVRELFYDYKRMDGKYTQKHSDARTNANVSILFKPTPNHQLQLAYFRKFFKPSYEALFMEGKDFTDEQWAITKGQLEERTIDQIKLAYAYSLPALTVQADASYLVVEEGENFAEIGASLYWRSRWITFTGGANLYSSKSSTYATVRVAPTAYLPGHWQVGLQLVYYTPEAPRRTLTGVPVYGCLTVNKQITPHWNLGVDWHDMFDSFVRDAAVNRHAGRVRIQYRF